MSNISLIATDLDGTLFYDRENISKRDREAIFSVHENGTAVALATGRELPIITPALDRLALWDAVDYIIMAGGAQIYTAKTQKIHTVGMLTPEILCDVYHRYQHHPISIILPRDNIFFTNRVTRGLRAESALLGSPIDYRPNLAEVFTASSPKLIFHGTDEEVSAILPFMQQDTDRRINLCRSHNNYIDCYAAGVNKGTALKLLCSSLDIPLDCCAAIGDNHNDLDLLHTAGQSACPGDGTEEAKAAADYVCCPAPEGAFADFCTRLGLI
jgi:hypothetical protein